MKAHWIVEDKGFGGTNYTCSVCRHTWNDIYQDVSREDYCPNCHLPIDDDEREYVENRPGYISYYGQLMTRGKVFKDFYENEQRLIQVSGYDIDKLIELFAAGYTLVPPKSAEPLKSLNDLI